MATVSVCMIVKDEQAVLARCLDCLAALADEIVIVDTGSTDRTLEIARRYTSLVYDFEWIGDFAAARNFAFSKCSMDYIFSADADEVLDTENQIRFKLLKNALLPEVEIVQMKYANQLEHGGVYNFDEEYRPKLFKRLRAFRWVSPIHETVELEPMVFDSDVVILHLPESAHSARDFQAFERASTRQPLDARLHHMYASELFIAGKDRDFQNAAAYFMRSLLETGRTQDEYLEARCVLARAARITGDEVLFFKSALRGAVGATPAELCCEIGEYYFSKGDWEEAAGWFYTAAGGAQSILNIHMSGDVPLERLAACYSRAGDEKEAVRWRAKAKEWKPPAARK